MDDLTYNIFCQCGGSLRFKVNSVSHDKQYICPNCSANLGVEIMHVLVNVKQSLKHHCETCQNLTNVQSVHLNGQLI